MTNPFSFASVEMRKNFGYSNWLRIIFIVLVIVAVFTLIKLKGNVSPTEKTPISPTPSATTTTKETIMDASKDQLEGYYRVYQNPSVIFLRKALNAYLANDSAGVNISMAAVQSETRDGIISGLSSFSKDYYKSKFVVVTINKGISGGDDIQILFQDKPDRIFYAWVYKLASGDYELRGFNSKENIDQKALKEMIDYYGPLLFDKTHSL